MMVVASDVRTIRPPAQDLTKTKEEPKVAVFLPSAEVLRDFVPRVPRPPAPRPAATPPPTGKDRISIGPPSTVRQKTPLVMHKDEEIVNTAPKGDPRAAEVLPPPPPQTPIPVGREAADARPGEGRPGLTMPPGVGREAASRPGDLTQGINESLERRLAAAGSQGIPNGSGT